MNDITAAIAPLLKLLQTIIALFAIIMAAVAVWKIGMNPMGVDAKTAAEVGAALAITFWCMK